MSEEKTRAVFIHLSNIPASSDGIFELYADGTLIFQTDEAIPADQECVIEAQLPVPKIAEQHCTYIRCVFKQLNLDVIHKCNLTQHGDYIQIKYAGNDKVHYRQRENNSDFDHASTLKIELEDDTKVSTIKEETYSFKKPKFDAKADSIMSQNDRVVPLFFHLANIPASKTEPFLISHETKILVMVNESMPLNRTKMYEAKVVEPKVSDTLIVNLRIKISACGIDVKQQFNITEKGQHILIAAVNNGENVKVMQRKDDKFDNLPWQAAPSSTSTSTGSKASNKASAKATVNFYLQGIDASFMKPFKIFVDKKEQYKLVQPVPQDQMVIVEVNHMRPSMDDDHIVNVGFFIPKMGFKDTVEQSFNITQHGKYIKLTMVDEGNLKYEMDVAQQHEPFEPEQGIKAVTDEQRVINSLVQTKIGDQPAKSTSPSSTPAHHVNRTIEIKKTSTTTELPPQLVSSTISKQPPQKQQPQSSSLDNVLADIEKLAGLRDRGILTEDEFQAKKKQLLGL